MSAPRYALYFAPPPPSDWWRFGSHWLGYDAATGATLEQPRLAGIDPEDLRAWTEAPRRYGFHATLKPPMQLRRGASLEQLIERLAALCAACAPFTLPQMAVRRIGGFVACVPDSRDIRLHALADACVRELDCFRAPSSTAEIAARRAHGVSARQDDYLLRWGYPYVLEEYRFHMTLTGRLETACADKVIAAVQPSVAALPPLVCDAVCVFEQPLHVAPFRIVARVALAPPAR